MMCGHSAKRKNSMKWRPTKRTFAYVSTCIMIGLCAAVVVKWRTVKMHHQYHFAAPHHSWAAARLLELDVRLPDAPLFSKLANVLVPTVYACTKPPCNNSQSKAVPLRNCGNINPNTGLPYCTEYTCASTTQNKICKPYQGDFWKGDPNCDGFCVTYSTDQGCTPP